MLNHVVIIGRIHKVSELLRTESGLYYAHIIVDIQRYFHNANNEYEHDFVKLTLMRGLAKESLAHCKVNNFVGVRARIQNHHVDNENHYDNEIIVEKISFLKTDDETTEL